MRYYVYYIPSKEYVGCTIDLRSRAKSHKVDVTDIDILYVTDDIEEASETEQSEQLRLLGKSDGYLYIDRHPQRRQLDVDLLDHELPSDFLDRLSIEEFDILVNMVKKLKYQQILIGA